MPQVVGICCFVEKTKVSGRGDFFVGILGGRVGAEWFNCQVLMKFFEITI